MTRHLLCIAMAAAALFAAVPTHGQTINIARPGDLDFIADLADIITPEHEQQIKQQADTLLSENAVPIIVVTISSMANHGYPDWRIENFARTLFDQWGIGHPEIDGTSWNRGILLLVSQGDRKARIELGEDWGRDNDQMAEDIMNGEVIPRFKQGDFSGGIVAGVAALDKMARGVPYPGPRGGGGRGNGSQNSGAAGAASGAAGAIGGCAAGLGQMIMLPFLLIAGLFSKLFGGGGGGRGGGGSFSGGNFSGGSFGGGSSGGGGATGSW